MHRVAEVSTEVREGIKVHLSGIENLRMYHACQEDDGVQGKAQWCIDLQLQ